MTPAPTLIRARSPIRRRPVSSAPCDPAATLGDGSLFGHALRRQDVGITALVLGCGEVPELDQAFVQ